MANRFLSNININDEYTLPSGDGAENQIIVTDGAGNLSFDDLSTVTGKVEGVEADVIYYEVKNSTGTTIDTFKGVMAVGTDGNSGHILIDEMVADGSVEARYFLGITRESIPNGGISRVISFGEIDQINTNAFPDGTVLWCDPANPGDFTATEPDGPNLKIPAAFVLNQATNGKIQVRVQGNEGIKDLYDTKITSQVDGDVLVWKDTEGVWQNDSTLNVDYTSSRVGIGTTSPGYKLDVAGDMNVGLNTGFDQNRLNFHEGFSYIAASAIFGSGSISMNIGSGEITLRSSGEVGIGTSSPSQKLHVNGNGVFSGNLGIGTTSPASKLHVIDSAPVLKLQSSSNSSSTVSFDNSSGTRRASLSFNETSDYLSLKNESGSGLVGFTPSQGEFTIGSFAQTGVIITNQSLTLKSNYSTALTCDFAGKVGIGTTSPQEKLHVQFYTTGESHQAMFKGGAVTVGDYSYISLNNGYSTEYNKEVRLAAVSEQSNSNKTGFAVLTSPDANGASGHERLRVTADGNVGIGIPTPSEKLEVDGNGRFYGDVTLYGDGSGVLSLNSPVGSMVSLNLNTPEFDFAGGSILINPAMGTTAFYTYGSERMRIDSAGSVGIGTTSPSYKLDVNGSIASSVTSGFPELRLSDAVSDFLLTTNSNGEGIIKTEGTSKNIRFFNNSGETMRISGGGNVGIGTTSPSYKLDVTGEGRFTGDLRCLSLIQTSEREYKKDIRLVGKENSTIPIKEYKYKTGDNDKVRYGVVAEDIESTYPELVERDADGVKGVKYIDLLVRKIAELETEKRTLVNWRHYHSNTSYNTLYDTGMTTAFPYAYGSIPAPYDMYFTSVTLVNNPYSSYNKGPLGDTATFQAYVNGKLAYEIRDIRYGQNPYESITADFGQNVRIRRGESLQIRFYANGIWRYCNSTIILTEI